VNELSYPDALERVAQRGRVQGAEAVLEAATAAAAISGLHPAPGDGPEPTAGGRRRLVARALVVGGIAAALLIGLVVVLRSGRGPERITTGTTPPPATPASSPHLAATVLPPGFVPDGVGEVGDGKTALHRRGEGPGTVQRFRGTTADGTPAELIVSVTPRPGAWGPEFGTVRGVPAYSHSFNGVAMVGWLPSGAGAGGEAWSSTLTFDQLRSVVEALRARGDDALAGFDPPAEPTAGVRWMLAAQHVATRDDAPPGSSFVSYRDPADGRRAVVVQGYAPVSGADLELVSLLPPGQLWPLAGAERMARGAEPNVPPLQQWTTVTWILADGSQAVVWTRGLSDAEVAGVVGGVGGVDDARWRRLEATTAADGWARLHLDEADVGPGHLQVQRGSRLSMLAITNTDLCLEVDDLGRLCVSQPATIDGGPQVVGPSGNLERVPTEVGAVIGSAARAGRWFVFGRNASGSPPQVQVNGSPVSVSTTLADGTLLFSLEVPVGTDRLDARFPESSEPITFTPPAEGYPQSQVR
jgi:hypothetical protein